MESLHLTYLTVLLLDWLILLLISSPYSLALVTTGFNIFPAYSLPTVMMLLVPLLKFSHLLLVSSETSVGSPWDTFPSMKPPVF